MKRLLTLLPLAALSAALAAAGDADFDSVVRHIETGLHIQRTHVPLLGLANLVVRSQPGVKQLDMAIFDNLDYSPPAAARFDEIMRDASGGGWSALLRVWSRRKSESTYIYAKPDGKDWRILLANFEPHEAVMIETRVTPEVLLRSLDGNSGTGYSIPKLN
jgi:hypothetical protein